MNADSVDGARRLTADDPLHGLNAWLAEGRVDEAAAERARQRWLERQASEDATLVGVLVDLAERGRPVAVRSRGGHTTRGPIVALGADFIAIREERLGDVLLPLAAVSSVRTASGDAPTTGARAASVAVMLGEALLELAVDRPEVLVSAANEEIRGSLRGSGRDIVSIQTDNQHRETITVAIAALDHLVILQP